MKVTKRQLKQIIKEELEAALSEFDARVPKVPHGGDEKKLRQQAIHYVQNGKFDASYKPSEEEIQAAMDDIRQGHDEERAGVGLEMDPSKYPQHQPLPGTEFDRKKEKPQRRSGAAQRMRSRMREQDKKD